MLAAHAACVMVPTTVAATTADRDARRVIPFSRPFVLLPQPTRFEVLAAYVAIEHMEGPRMEFVGGRVDAQHAAAAIAPGRLPGAEAGCVAMPPRRASNR